MKKIILSLLAFMVSSALFAYDFQSGDLYYNITSHSAPYTVEVTYQKYSSLSNYSGLTAVVVPSTVEHNSIEYEVTSIGNEAFWRCYSLKSVTLPSSVTRIGGFAFDLCTSLTSIEFPNTMTSIGNDAFNGCSSLASIEIPASVTFIGSQAFSSCPSLSGITVDAGNAIFDSRDACNAIVDKQSNKLIVGCKNTVIPSSVTTIGDAAFYGCSSLDTLSFSTLTPPSFEGRCFNQTSSALTFHVPCGTRDAYLAALTENNTIDASQVTEQLPYIYSLSANPAMGVVVITQKPVTCADLTLSFRADAALGYSFTQWSDGNTDNPRTLHLEQDATLEAEFAMDSTYRIFYTSADGNIVTPHDTTVFGANIVSNTYSGDQGVILFDGPVKSIGYAAFSDCSTLTSITIPNSVTSIKRFAFSDCGLTSIIIPNSVTTIGTYDYDYIFSGTDLVSMVVEEGNPVYDSRNGCNAIIETSTNTLIAGCKNTIIPDNVISIGATAFCDCYGLTSITIPNSVTSIGDYAFFGTGLTSVTIPNSVISIGDRAFEAIDLTSVMLSNGLESIGEMAFAQSNLSSITIPNSVTYIGEEVFWFCEKLKSITVESGNPVYDSRNGCNAIIETSTNTLIAGCKNTVIPNDVEEIGDRAFSYCFIGPDCHPTAITIPNSVKRIGNNAFNSSSKLTSIILSDSLECIGSKAFCYTGLSSITIPNSVISIGDSAFYNCSKLTSTTFDSSTPPTIGEECFRLTPSSLHFYVPCGSKDAYVAALNANNTVEESRVVEQLAFTYSVSSADSLQGTTTLLQEPTCVDPTLSFRADAAAGYSFAQWSDGNTDNPRTLLLTQDVALRAEFIEESSYCRPTGLMSGTKSRRLSHFAVTDGKTSTSFTDVQPTYTSPIYVDRTSSQVVTTAGSVMHFNGLNWLGGSMNGYVYIDYNQDGAFSEILNTDGTGNGELVSYSYLSGYNSLGDAVASNEGITTESMPSWRLPVDLPNGVYRVRFKIDYDNASPCGRSSIGTNNGCIVDFELRVESPSSCEPPTGLMSGTKSRRLSSFSLTDGKNTTSFADVQPTYTSPIYVDRTSLEVVSTAGSEIRFSRLNWLGSSMNGYVYIDYNQDGAFSEILNADGTGNGELVSYSYLSGYNSLGDAVASNEGITTESMPSWRLPVDLPNGVYRVRFKVDYDNASPCGRSSIGTNNGCIVDFELRVESPSSCEPPTGLMSGTKSRRLNSFSITDGKITTSFTDVQPTYTSPIYVDRTSIQVISAAGSVIKFNKLNWQGGSMNGYVYIDYNQDGAFSEILNADGTGNGELVSYSYLSGYNSLGDAVASNGGVSTESMPSWRLPVDLPNGVYRVRFKIDYDNANPCGRSSIGTNNGCIVDFELRVELPASCEPSTELMSGTKSRRLDSFSISDGEHTMSFSSLQPTITSPVYADRRGYQMVTTAGSTISFSTLNWQGSWMNGYVYIDYNNDGAFNENLNADGTNSGELVSYSYLSGYNSHGEVTSIDQGVTKNTMPSWTLPSDLEDGIYHVRFKIDYDNASPCGRSSIGTNNGCIVDFELRIGSYVRSKDKYVIREGESVYANDFFIEASEDDHGFHAGQIVFDKTSPTGSLNIGGHLIIRCRVYKDRWHDLSFPVEMQGVGGTEGICIVGADGSLAKLPPTGKHLLYEFSSADRNKTGSKGGTKKSSDATLKPNKFYEFAADVPDGFVPKSAGVVNGVPSYWVQFHSVATGFVISPTLSPKTHTLSYTGASDAAEYWNRNVFTMVNPFLSNINVQEITASLGWENLSRWNAVLNRYEGISAVEDRDLSPYFGYWLQLSDEVKTGDAVSVVLGNSASADYPYADSNDRVVNFAAKMAPRASLSSSFDMPDAYTIGIDAVEDFLNPKAVSTTIVTLTDAGSVDAFRSGYDMPVSLISESSSVVPEIWSKAGSSRMMFNDVQREDEVVVPVGIRIKEAGEYALRLTHTNDTTALVQVRDNETGAVVDLQNDGSKLTYLFLADEGDSDRFDLVISKAPKMVTGMDFVEMFDEELSLQVFVRGGNLCLRNISTEYSVAVSDVLGRVYLKTPVTSSDMILSLPEMQGVYVVNILNKQNVLVKSVKVIK